MSVPKTHKLITLLLLLLALSSATRLPGAAAKASPLLFTAGLQVTALAVGADGTLWAATRGGVLHWNRGDSMPRQWSTTQGLAGNEMRVLSVGKSSVLVANAQSLNVIAASGEVSDAGAALSGQEIHCLWTSPATDDCWIGASRGLYLRQAGSVTKKLADPVLRLARLAGRLYAVSASQLIRVDDGARWPLPDQQGNVTALTECGDRLYLATAFGLWQFTEEKWTDCPLPAGSTGSHVSALTVREGALVAALFGDRLYARDAHGWQTLGPLPEALRAVTTLAAGPAGLILGTRERGVWRQAGNGWLPYPMPESLPCTDIYAVAEYHGQLWASTFDHGLLCRNGSTWRVLTPADGLSTVSPRELLVFHDKLFVRHTTGELDCFDGTHWQPAFSKKELPRPGVYALAADAHYLYLGLWAGWAATDGSHWDYCCKEPLLKDHAVTAIAAAAGTVWVGTQGQGLIAFTHGVPTQYHESSGLTDDWITRIACQQGRLLVGTYNGGLLEWTGKRFHQLMTANGYAIRDIRFQPNTSRAFVATSQGLYRETVAGWQLLSPAHYGGAESQALFPTAHGLWVGSRTALAWLPWDTITQSFLSN